MAEPNEIESVISRMFTFHYILNIALFFFGGIIVLFSLPDIGFLLMKIAVFITLMELVLFISISKYMAHRSDNLPDRFKITEIVEGNGFIPLIGITILSVFSAFILLYISTITNVLPDFVVWGIAVSPLVFICIIWYKKKEQMRGVLEI